MTGSYGHRWTNSELKKLMDLWQRDVPIIDIADTLKMKPPAIGQMVTRLRKSGIPLKLRKRGNPRGNSANSWSQADVEYVLRRRKEGATCYEIAREVDRTFYGVQAMVLKLRAEGLKIKKLGAGRSRLWDIDVLKAKQERP